MLHIASLTLIAVSLTITIAFAQQKELPDSVKINQVSHDLSISKDQSSKVWQAMQVNRGAIADLIKDKTISLTQKQEQLKRLIQERENQVNALLTLAQQTQLKAVINNRLGDRRKADVDKVTKRHEGELNGMSKKRATKMDTTKRN